MMIAIEFNPHVSVLDLVRKLMEAGFLTLPCGANAEALQLSPPAVTSPALRDLFVSTLAKVLETV